MINPTELRKGNMVDYERTNHIVTELHSDKCLHLWVHSGSDGYYTPYALIEPIPLTPELLEEMGLIQPEGKSWYIHPSDLGKPYAHLRINLVQGKWTISIGDDDIGILFATVDCLHMLQNIFFYISGIELKYTPSAPQSPNT